MPLPITVASGETSSALVRSLPLYNKIKRRLELSWIANGGRAILSSYFLGLRSESLDWGEVNLKMPKMVSNVP